MDASTVRLQVMLVRKPFRTNGTHELPRDSALVYEVMVKSRFPPLASVAPTAIVRATDWIGQVCGDLKKKKNKRKTPNSQSDNRVYLKKTTKTTTNTIYDRQK